MTSVKVKFKCKFILDLPEGQCASIWGPRQAGKSTYLTERYPNSVFFDLLKTDIFLELSKAAILASGANLGFKRRAKKAVYSS